MGEEPAPTSPNILHSADRWASAPLQGRNAESPGEDAWLNGVYGSQLVRGGQGATVDGTYGKFRKAINEMKHFTACKNPPMEL